MKRLILLILLFILFIPLVSADSIDDLYKELDILNAYKDVYNYLDDDDINIIFNDSLDISNTVNLLEEDINIINKDISKKEEEITLLKENIDNALVFNQISKDENIYLEYIFDANSYSDMIYRYMIMKQLTEYNNSLIDKLNNEIIELNNKKEIINDKLNKLYSNRNKYRHLEMILKSRGYLTSDSISSSIIEDINNLKEEIALYESIGCSRYMDLSICLNIKDGNNLIYPLDKGCVTKDYSSRHKGIDLACNLEGTNVYSASLGVVGFITYKATYGGNIIYIYHIIDGKKYTTIYGHLLEVKVKVGDIVNSNTVIGLLGGESTAYINGGYDKGTNGAHLHYAVVEGFHVNDFNIYTLNPRLFNNYPSVLNNYFYR